ncbi:MAG: hypothetical protein WKF50_14640, partial [Nocardioides sp.]
VVDEPNYDSKVKRLDRFVDDTGKDLTPARHKKCPGHVAWLGGSWDYVDVDGVPVARVDHSAGHRRVQSYASVSGCADPRKHGHADRYSHSGSSSSPKAADMSDEEREKASAARRLVIDNNKAWASAETVRREWLAEFASRKTAPKGAAAFVVQALQNDLNELLSWSSNEMAAEWLSLDARTGFAAAAEKATEGRALQIALVQVLGLYEAKSSQQDWRSSGKTSRAGRYLRFLDSCGYGLSTVEKFALNTKTA